jgi:hypothetical protein
VPFGGVGRVGSTYVSSCWATEYSRTCATVVGGAGTVPAVVLVRGAPLFVEMDGATDDRGAVEAGETDRADDDEHAVTASATATTSGSHRRMRRD